MITDEKHGSSGRSVISAGALISERVMLKHDRFFVVSAKDGSIDAHQFLGDGLWSGDTRLLSRFRLLIDGVAPAPSGVDASEGWATFHHVAGSIEITRTRFVDRGLRERITLANTGPATVDVVLELDVAADFAAMLAIRGHVSLPPPAEATPIKTVEGVRFAREGSGDGYASRVICMPEGLKHQARLAPGTRFELQVEVIADTSLARIEFDRGFEALVGEYPSWSGEAMSIETDNRLVNEVLDRAAADIRMLCNRYDTGLYPTGGLPWYAVPFGRDTLITSMQLLPFNPELARGVLRFQAAHQGRRIDEDSEEQPGKILHEVRTGEVVERGLWPHVLYGTIDATPLFLCLYSELDRWTADSALAEDLWPAAEAALEWCVRYGDSDGDGYIEYHGARARNQGWKDSDDSLTHVDGADASRPAALCEVQAYLYRALIGLSRRRPELKDRASALKRSFNRDFWMADERYVAQALDGSKRQVKAITSNPGHCLWMGIVPPARGRDVGRRLVAAELFSGWGVRTLSDRAVNYNPNSYHNGSVWPFDSAIAAAGLREYGLNREAAMLSRALFEAAFEFPLRRPPELFCGDARQAGEPPQSYWNTCTPQLWSAAAMYQLVTALLGITADARSRKLCVAPIPTSLWNLVEVRGLHFLGERVDLSIEGARLTAHRAPAGIKVGQIGSQ